MELRKTFTKDDLKTGMLVELRDGEKYMVFKDAPSLNTAGTDCLVNINRDDWFYLSNFTDSIHLVNSNHSSDWDIVRVFQAKHPYAFTGVGSEYQLIWERVEKSPQQLKIEELEQTINKAKQQIEELKEENK